MPDLGVTRTSRLTGGATYLPTSKNNVKWYAEGIAECLLSQTADIVLVQELSGPCILNHAVDVRARLVASVPHATRALTKDTQTPFLPSRWVVDIGKGVFSTFHIDSASVVKLASERG